jgi:hypothetical protein
MVSVIGAGSKRARRGSGRGPRLAFASMYKALVIGLRILPRLEVIGRGTRDIVQLESCGVSLRTEARWRCRTMNRVPLVSAIIEIGQARTRNISADSLAVNGCFDTIGKDNPIVHRGLYIIAAAEDEFSAVSHFEFYCCTPADMGSDDCRGLT